MHLIRFVGSTDGQFGAMMQVHIQNDGPVTLDIESPTLRQLLDEQAKKDKESKTETQ